MSDSGEKDNGGDLVETAFLAQGLICVREYFQNLGYLNAQNSKVIGYPKFDIFEAVGKKSSFKFKNGKDFVLYNPHYQKKTKTYDTCLNKMIAR